MRQRSYPADRRLLDPGLYSPDPASNFYLVHLLASHSYSVDMWDPVDLFIGGPGQIELLSSPGCSP